MSDTCNANDGVGYRILVNSVWEERAIFLLSFTCIFVCVSVCVCFVVVVFCLEGFFFRLVLGLSCVI